MPKKAAPPFANHAACQTLTGLTLEHLPRDGSLGRLRRFRKGDDIWRPDERADRIYFLRRGQVATMTSDAQGSEVIIQMAGAGEPFGELCFCSQERGLWHTTGRALVESEALEVKHRDFVKYVQQDREALLRFVFTFCNRLSEANRRVEVLAHRGAEDRLGRLLLQLAATPGQPTDGGTKQVVLHIGHEELAKLAAMSRSHVTVTMGKLRRRKVVRYARNRPLIVDVPALTAYLENRRGASS